MRGHARVVKTLLAASVLPLPGGCVRHTAQSPAATIYTGGTSGVYYQYGEALRTSLGSGYRPLNVVPTSGSVDNIGRLATMLSGFAIVAADVAAAAGSGQPRPSPGTCRSGPSRACMTTSTWWSRRTPRSTPARSCAGTGCRSAGRARGPS